LNNFVWLSVASVSILSAFTLIIARMPIRPYLLAAGGSPLTASAIQAEPTPQPTPDRLAIPVIPENPTQVDQGRLVYYYNCMPCHGDRGQGLTDEFRQLWVEDHRNCWEIGCHGGHLEDEGFPLPQYIPSVSGSPDSLIQFHNAESLYEFLSQNHPPQRPGALDDQEYWAVAAFLWYENGRLGSSESIGPVSQVNVSKTIFSIAGISALTLLVGVALVRQAKQTTIP
jgi:hypothetical protein